MDLKKIIYVVAIILVIIVLVHIIRINTKTTTNDEQVQNNVVYNEIDNSYTIYDEENNIRAVVHSEPEAKKYMDNPDYDPGVPEVTATLEMESPSSDLMLPVTEDVEEP